MAKRPTSYLGYASYAEYIDAICPPYDPDNDPLALLAKIWAAGDWRAETVNERRLEAIMRKRGYWS